MTTTPKTKAKRGFAAMSEEKQKEIASKGGVAAHRKGTAHQFSPEEAREAGRKGGRAAQLARLAGKPTKTAAQAAGETPRIRTVFHRLGTPWHIGNAVILGNDPKTCNHIYPRTRAGNCHGCGSTEGQYPGPATGDSP